MIALWLAGAYLTLLIVKAALTLRAARLAPQPGDEKAADDVTIVQAILSGDPRLRETLEENVRALPGARFVWLIDEDDPAAGGVCRELVARYERTPIDVIVMPPPPARVNPKLFKLEAARQLVGHRVFVVLDDDTRMPPESLSAMLAGLSASQLTTGLPGYVDDGRWPSKLLAEFVNNNAALTYLPLLNIWPPPTINGMAYAMRGATIDGLGGFTPVMDRLTDDLAVARLVLDAGGRVAQTASPHWVQTTVTGHAHYWRLMHRWMLFGRLLLARQGPLQQAAIIVLNALPPLLLWAVVAATAVTRAPAALGAALLVIALRACVIAGIQRRVYGRWMHRPLYSLASEWLMPLHLAHAFVSNTIVWRTRRYRVRGDRSFELAS